LTMVTFQAHASLVAGHPCGLPRRGLASGPASILLKHRARGNRLPGGETSCGCCGLLQPTLCGAPTYVVLVLPAHQRRCVCTRCLLNHISNVARPIPFTPKTQLVRSAFIVAIAALLRSATCAWRGKGVPPVLVLEAATNVGGGCLRLRFCTWGGGHHNGGWAVCFRVWGLVPAVGSQSVGYAQRVGM
jgi:hypothetical protein